MEVNSNLEFVNLTNDEVWLLWKQQPMPAYNALREEACDLWFAELGTPEGYNRMVGMYNLTVQGMVLPRLGFAVSKWIAENGFPTEPEPVSEPEPE